MVEQLDMPVDRHISACRQLWSQSDDRSMASDTVDMGFLLQLLLRQVL